MTDFDFNKNLAVSDLSVVPEKFQSLYEESTNDDGETVFNLQDNVKPLVEAYSGTNKALAAARADKTKASNESAERRIALKEFEQLVDSLGLEIGDEGVSAALKAHIDALTADTKGGEKLKASMDKIQKDAEKRIEAAQKEAQLQIDERDASLFEHLITNTAMREIADMGGNVTVLLPHVEKQCKVFRTDDGKYAVYAIDSDGDARSDGEGGFMGVKHVVAELKAHSEFGGNFKSEDDKGSLKTVPGATKKVAGTNKQEEPKTAVQNISAGLKQRFGNR